MIFHSIRWRLQIWLAFLLLCVLTGFGVSVYHLQRATQMNQLDQELERRVAILSALLRRRPPMDFPPGRPPLPEDVLAGREPRAAWPPPLPPPGIARREGPRERERSGRERVIELPAESAGLFDASSTHGFYYALFSRSGVPIGHSSNAPPDLPLPARATATLTQVRERGGQREAFYFTGLGECVVVGRSILPEIAALNRFALLLCAAGAGVLALGLGGGWLLTTRAIRPIDQISATAVRIASGDLSHRINAEDTDSELGRLAGVLNSTFSRLETAFAQQARFTADAAHELRTPVAVMLTHTQNGLSCQCPNDEHREAFEACQRAAQRMRRLVESLLQLARLDAGQESLRRTDFDLARSASDCIELLRPLAVQKRIHLEAFLGRVECYGDAERISQIITNLLANAIQYTPAGGRVQIHVARQDHGAVLEVCDNGPGLAAKDLSQVFERFYRADESRALEGGQTGRSGLGLAISKAIVEAHGGSITAASQPGAGARFTVRLPAARPPESCA